MTARHRRVPLLALLFAATTAVVFAGCGKQGEGQRCVYDTAGNADCNSGLVCVREQDLQQSGADRCCPPEGQPIHVGSCTRRSSIGSGGSGGSATDAGSDAADASGGGAAGAAGAAGAGGAGGTSGAGGASDASTD